MLHVEFSQHIYQVLGSLSAREDLPCPNCCRPMRWEFLFWSWFEPGELIFLWNLYFYLYFFDQLIYSLLSRQWPSWSSLSEGPWPVHRLNKDWFLLISSIIARFCCFKEQEDHLRLLLNCGLFALVLLPSTLNPGGWFLKPMKGFLLKERELHSHCTDSNLKSHII